METKQVIVIRKDLKMRRGKECAQCAHASMGVFTKNMRFIRGSLPGERPIFYLGWIQIGMAVYHWFRNSFKKVVVYVTSEEELLKIYEQAKDADLPCSLIQDSGKTEFHGEPTYTTVAVGPAEEEEVNKITGELPLY